ncbi:hypothetical protein MAR_018264 [Mya arenaria]|uniref:Uncharacterized protein n=1 Tax=Mya arenaria TaxID=6604 RepID=A0ABY7EM89_MYAAR|nr:hypothetical protein MAR_018264 [Mya arenaria]
MIPPSQTPAVGVTRSTTSSSVSTFSSSLSKTALSPTSTTPSTTSSNCAFGSGVCVTHTDGLGSNENNRKRMRANREPIMSTYIFTGPPASRPSMSLVIAVLLPLHVALIGGQQN